MKKISLVHLTFLIIFTAALLSAHACTVEPAPAEVAAGEIDRYKQYAREALPDSLVAVVTCIRDRAVEAEDYETWGTGTLILANRCARTDDYDSGIAMIEDFLERTAASTDDPATLYRAYFLTGEFYYVNGFQNIALDYFITASDHAATDREKSRVYYAIGISSGNIHYVSAGIDPNTYFDMAEELAKRTDDSVMVAQALFGRATAYFDFLGAHKIKNEPLGPARRDSIGTAVALLLEAKDYAPGMDVSNYALGLSHAALKDFDKAQYYINLVEGDEGSIVGANVRASLLICMGRYADALAVAQKAYDIGLQTGNESEMRNSLHIIYYARKYSGDTARALDAFERFSEKMQRLTDESLARQVNVARVRFDTRLKEEQLAATEKENSLYRKGLLIIGCAFLLVAALLVLVVRYYRKIRKAHRALVHKSQQWAREPITPSSAPADGRDDTGRKALIEKLDEWMSREKPYLRPNLTIVEAAGSLEVNRTYLSDAVNRIYGNNFTAYLNELRIRDAVNLISDPTSDQYTVDGLARMSGFSNRKTFHNAFVRTTGLTPSEFRRNRTTSAAAVPARPAQ